MGQFYLLSEVLTPVMAWGFLGTDSATQQHCLQLKVCLPEPPPGSPVSCCLPAQETILHFLHTVFSLEGVRYSTASALADDILSLAQHTAGSMAVSS